MAEFIKSAWWIIYYIDKNDKEPRFFLVKRHALSWKIERVSPKWKIEKNEDPKDTVIREVWEEVWIKPQNLKLEDRVWEVILMLRSQERWSLDKKIAYYLVEYIWDFSDIDVAKVEWYLWYHKWATIQEISWLIYYENLRHLFFKAYNIIKEK